MGGWVRPTYHYHCYFGTGDQGQFYGQYSNEAGCAVGRQPMTGGLRRSECCEWSEAKAL